MYFPPGTYVVSAPIVQYYYTQLVGDAIAPPTIKASASFQGIAVIDSDPYGAGGFNWYTVSSAIMARLNSQLTQIAESE